MPAVGPPAELGVLLPPVSGAGAWARLLAAAERAARAGAASVWVPDAAGDPVPPLAGLAGRLDLRLGLFGVRPGRRPLTVLAKELAGLDVISHGRLEVAVGDPAAEPADVAEAVEVLGGLMEGGPFDHSGRLASARQARCLPAAAQRPHPPLWVVGTGVEPAEVAGDGADGWLAGAADPASFRRLGDGLDEACRRSGRDPSGLRRGAVLPPGAEPGDLEEWAAAGATLVLATGEP